MSGKEMDNDKSISDRTYEDLCIHDLVVEGATQVISEYCNADMANGLMMSFMHLRDDVKELINMK